MQRLPCVSAVFPPTNVSRPQVLIFGFLFQISMGIVLSVRKELHVVINIFAHFTRDNVIPKQTIHPYIYMYILFVFGRVWFGRRLCPHQSLLLHPYPDEKKSSTEGKWAGESTAKMKGKTSTKEKNHTSILGGGNYFIGVECLSAGGNCCSHCCCKVSPAGWLPSCWAGSCGGGIVMVSWEAWPERLLGVSEERSSTLSI